MSTMDLLFLSSKILVTVLLLVANVGSFILYRHTEIPKEKKIYLASWIVTWVAIVIIAIISVI